MEFRALVSETEFFAVFLDSCSERAEVLYSLGDSLVEHVSSKGVLFICSNLLLRKDPSRLEGIIIFATEFVGAEAAYLYP